jgi:outer membrane receptor protein involved in Fe transport
MQELYSNYAGGNPELDPQQTITYEVGVDHRFSSRVSGGIAFFYNDVSDLIFRRDYNDETIYINVDDAVYQGFEVSLDMNPLDNLFTGLNYTYLSTLDEETDRELAERPRHRVNADVRYRFGFGLTASVQGSYTQRQFDQNRRKLPDFFLLGARLAQDIPITDRVDTTLFVEGSNLTDVNYDQDNGPEPGRMYRAGLAFRF